MRALAPEEQAIIAQLQDAARIMQTPGVPRGQMLHAEEIFKNFRRTEKPYGLCKHILENNMDQVMLYQVACALKDALIREWRFVEENDRTALRSYLFSYIVTRTQQEALVYPVREKLVQVIAVMVKRECIDDTGEKKSAFLKNLYEHVTRGELPIKMVGASLICAVLQEFAVMTKSSDFGLPFADHFKAKRMFELQDLLDMFRFVVRMLKELEHLPPPYSEQQEGIYEMFLEAAESILSWTFVSLFCIPRRIQSSFETDTNATFRPPPAWKADVLKSELVHLFFNIYCRVNPSYPNLRLHAVTCLYQLASLNRFLTTDEENTKVFLQHFLRGWMYLTENATALSSNEALGLTNIVRRLTLFFSPAFFARLPEELRLGFFERLSTLTQVMALKACEEDAAGDEENKFGDALEYTLQTWLGILLDPGSLPMMDLAKFCCPAFDAYVLCHLGPPQGRRLMRDEEEITEVEEPDRVKYREQLSALGVIGRAFPGHVLPLLVNCLEDRLPMLQNFVCASGDNSSVPPVTTQMTSLFEDIHWLLLIAGSTLLLSTDDSGLDNHVPIEIMEYSASRSKNPNEPPAFPVSFQEKFRGLRIAESPCMISQSDPLVRLFCDGLALSEILCNAELRGRGCILSPELMSTSYWFLERFVKAYLVPAENSYSAELSLNLIRAFGMDTDGSRWVISFVFECACSSLNIWNAEEGVLNCITSMLKALGRDRKKGRMMSEVPAFWALVGMLSTEQFRRLPSKCVKAMMTFIVLAASHTGDKTANEAAVKKCLWYPLEQFEVLAREDLTKMEGNEVARSHILYIIDLLTGAADAGLMATSELLFTLSLTALKLCAERILVVFNNDVPTVDAVLELLNSVAVTLVSYLSKPATEELFKISLATIANYAKFNVGKRTRETVNADNEDVYHDILVIIDILSNLLSRDYLDLSPEVLLGISTAPTPTVTAAQVSLEGMNLLMPLMTHDLLSCPPLCKAFYRLLAFISVISADTFAQLTPDRQGMFYNVVVTGLTAFDAEVTKHCLDITSVLALQVMDHPNSPLRAMMSGFVKVILELSLGETLRSDNITAIGTCLFSLLCAFSDVFQQQVDVIIAKLRAEDQSRGARLDDAFKLLLHDVRPAYASNERSKFIVNFEKYAIEAQAVFLTM